jgi:hypothetical protein
MNTAVFLMHMSIAHRRLIENHPSYIPDTIHAQQVQAFIFQNADHITLQKKYLKALVDGEVLVRFSFFLL